MRIAVLVITAAAIIAATPACAEEPTALPEITVIGAPPRQTASPGGSPAGAGAPLAAGHPRCDAATSGGEPSFDCLNEKLKKQVDQINPVLNAPPIDARSPDIKVGTVNVPAVQQQYGQNFGRSVVPYRAPPLVFSSPMAPHR
jgi:hypothetical protein